MIVKGIVSAINSNTKTISVILPEYNNVVTRPIMLYEADSFDSLRVNDFVLVVVFNDDFNDCIVLNKYGTSGVTATIENDILTIK